MTYSRDGITIHHAPCEDVLRELSDDSIDLIVTDPPYHSTKKKTIRGDCDFTDDGYLGWIGLLCEQWQRVLKPNGSLYLFASPQMSWGVEGEVRKRFNVLTNIRWRKPPFSTKAEMFVKDELRAPFPCSETIIFAEQFAAREGITNAEYDLNGSVYRPIKDWFRSRANGVTPKAFNERLGFATTGSGMAGTIIGDKAEFCMPTPEVYAKMQDAFPAFDRDYKDLRREYEDLRRPFYASTSRPYTDVFDFATVADYPGKHPAEKPLAMIEHIIQTSSRADALVLDCFAGSGVVGEACRNFGRRAILCEIEARWYNRIVNRMKQQKLFAGAEA